MLGVVPGFYRFGAHKSYNSLSAGSKHVTKAGSTRIMTFPRGESKVGAKADETDRGMLGRPNTERDWLLSVVDVGDASPGWFLR